MSMIDSAHPIDLAVLGAVPFEVAGLLPFIQSPDVFRFLGEAYRIGRYKGLTLLVGAVGFGKVNAAISTAALLERFRILQVWNVGCCGAYAGGPLSVGDVLITLDFICGDEGVLTQTKALSQEHIGIPLAVEGDRELYGHFPWSGRPIMQRLTQALPEGCYEETAAPAAPQPAQGGCSHNERSGGFRLLYGPSLTVSMASGDDATAVQRFNGHHAYAENMEGSALALACLRFNVPMVECRGVSNWAGNRRKEEWRMETAIAHCHRVLSTWMDVISDQ